jgi:hypothetical protein
MVIPAKRDAMFGDFLGGHRWWRATCGSGAGGCCTWMFYNQFNPPIYFVIYSGQISHSMSNDTLITPKITAREGVVQMHINLVQVRGNRRKQGLARLVWGLSKKIRDGCIPT